MVAARPSLFRGLASKPGLDGIELPDPADGVALGKAVEDVDEPGMGIADEIRIFEEGTLAEGTGVTVTLYLGGGDFVKCRRIKYLIL